MKWKEKDKKILEKIAKDISRKITGEEGFYKYILKEGKISREGLERVAKIVLNKKIRRVYSKIGEELIVKGEFDYAKGEDSIQKKVERENYPEAFFYSFDEKNLVNSLVECYVLGKALERYEKERKDVVFPFGSYLKLNVAGVVVIEPLYKVKQGFDEIRKFAREDFFLKVSIETNFVRDTKRISFSDGFTFSGALSVISNVEELLYYSILINYIRILKKKLGQKEKAIIEEIKEKVNMAFEIKKSVEGEVYKKNISMYDLLNMEILGLFIKAKNIAFSNGFRKLENDIREKINVMLLDYRNFLTKMDFAYPYFENNDIYYIIQESFPEIVEELYR